MEVATMTPLICLFCLTHDFEAIAFQTSLSCFSFLNWIWEANDGSETNGMHIQ